MSLRSAVLMALLACSYSPASYAKYAVDSDCAPHLQPKIADGQSKTEKALQAAPAFLEYFQAASQQIFEREYVLEPFELAWLAKEHILMIGPAGNAKTTLAKLLMQNVVEEVAVRTVRPAAPAEPTSSWQDQFLIGRAPVRSESTPQSVDYDVRIEDRASFFTTQMTAETSLSDTHGPVDFKALNETGRVQRLYEDGILGAHFAFIDEQFDMRPNGYRNILDVLAERAHSQGTRQHQGKTWTVVGASNTYLPEVYQKFDGNDQPRALIDRYSFVIYIPAEMEMRSSNRAIVQGSKQARSPLPRLTFGQIASLQALVPDVTIPDHVSDMLSLLQYRMRPELESREAASVRQQYEKVQAGEKAGPPWRATKYMSPRTLGKAAGVLRAIVVLDWAKKGGKRDLVATIDDLEKLQTFYALGGPKDKFVESQMVRASKEAEQEQLKSIRVERQIFAGIFEAIRTEFNQAIANYTPHEIMQKVDSYKNLPAPERRVLVDLLREIYLRTLEATKDVEQDNVAAERIAEAAIHESVKEWIQQIFAERTEFVLRDWTQNKPLAERPSGKKKAARRYAGIPGLPSGIGAKKYFQADTSTTTDAYFEKPIYYEIPHTSGSVLRDHNSFNGFWELSENGFAQVTGEGDGDYRAYPYSEQRPITIDWSSASAINHINSDRTSEHFSVDRSSVSQLLSFRTKEHLHFIDVENQTISSIATADQQMTSKPMAIDIDDQIKDQLRNLSSRYRAKQVSFINKSETKAWLTVGDGLILLEADLTANTLKLAIPQQPVGVRILGLSRDEKSIYTLKVDMPTSAYSRITLEGAEAKETSLDLGFSFSAINYDSNKNWMLVASNQEGLIAVNPDTGKVVRKLIPTEDLSSIENVFAMTFTKEGKLLVLGLNSDHRVVVYEFQPER